MENTNEKTVKVLNGLIEINNDRVDGYDKASVTDNAALKAMFQRFAETSRKNVPALSAEVGRLGGEAATGNTTSGTFYHAWMEVKTAILGKADDQAIVNLCEFGEDAAVEAYDDALKTEGLDPKSRELILSQFTEIKAAHDKVRDLKKAEEAKH